MLCEIENIVDFSEKEVYRYYMFNFWNIIFELYVVSFLGFDF